MRILIAAAVTAVLCVVAAAQEPEVQKTVAGFARAWEQKNAAALAGLYAEDADVVGGAGQPVRGRAAISRLHEMEFTMVPKGSTLSLKVHNVRMILPDHAFVDGTYEVSPQGPGSPAEMGTWGSYTMLLRKENEGWRIVAFRPAADARAVLGAMAGAMKEMPPHGAEEPAQIERGAEVRGLGAPLTPAEHKTIAAKVAAIAGFKDHRIRVIRAAEDASQDEEKAAGGPKRRLASVIVFDYTTGRAVHVTYDIARGEILGEKDLAGRPQSSEEERREAEGILKETPELTALFREGAQVEGGFVVDAPANNQATNRYLQFQVQARDREKILRLAIVDLTTRKVVASWVPKFER
jgi:uncharacterized protein (TIGR02246 family)